MMRGATPLCTPRSGGLRPPRPPWVGLPGPHPGFLSFHDERNQRRAGAAPLDPLRGARCPPCGVAAPPRKGSRHNKRPICHFGFMGKSVLFFPLVSSREHFLFSIRGSAGGLCSLRAARSFSPFWGEQRLRCWGDDNAPQGEYPEGDTPSGRFFGDFLIGEKVTRGAGRSARMVGAGATSSAKAPGAPSMARPCSRGAPAQSSPFVWDIQKRGQFFSIFHKNILPERVAFMQYKGNSKNAGNGAVFEL